jgi:hypothetical protein
MFKQLLFLLRQIEFKILIHAIHINPGWDTQTDIIDAIVVGN